MVRAGALGDLLLLRPALHALRAAGWELELLAPSAAAALLGGTAARLAWESAGVAALLAGLDAPEELEQRLAGCDAALAFTRSPELVRALERRIGRVVTADPLPPEGTHAATWCVAAAQPLGAAPEAPPPLLDPGEAARAEAESFARRLPPRFLALHPGSGSPRKNWPADRFAAFARGWSRGRPWLLVEGPADREAAAPLAGLPGATPARELPLATLAALLGRAGLYVGNDSGVSHLAAAVGAPTLALFGPTDPVRWAPRGAAVRVLRPDGGVLERLPVDAVRDAAAALAAGSAG